MKYKRGEVSKILNIPFDTLRYYEQKNIINPSKGENNNYRFYDAWDINFLLECKKFRSYDFSLVEIEEILHKGSLKDFIDKIDDRQQYIEKKLEYYKLLEKKNFEYSKSLKGIQTNLNKCTISEQPGKYYFIHRYNYSYEYAYKIGDVAKVWLEYFPFVDFMVELPQKAVMERESSNEYKWGFSVNKEYAKAFNLPLNDKVKVVDAKKCVYTVICAGEKGSFSLKLLNNAMDYMEKSNLKLCGDVTGNLLTRVHEPEGFSRYIEVWLPIE